MARLRFDYSGSSPLQNRFVNGVGIRFSCELLIILGNRITGFHRVYRTNKRIGYDGEPVSQPGSRRIAGRLLGFCDCTVHTRAMNLVRACIVPR
jgi:hypothetical protein